MYAQKWCFNTYTKILRQLFKKISLFLSDENNWILQGLIIMILRKLLL